MSLPRLYAAALGLALLFAFLKGSREAKLIAVGYFIAQVAAIEVHPGRWDNPQLGAFAVDLVLLGWIVWIITKTPLMWPIAAGVLQSLTVLGHLARLTVPTMDKMGYFILLQWTAWPAFVAIVVGTILDWRAGRTSSAFWRMRA